ncbi:GSCFA domain-containing protein [Flavobacterium sp.]|uniref:GSCFA domain-containing protein n=1 Tax=Flavobacterium sp. TaxID=239 RepID=UPI0026271E38|nr:GSCFA domain-containing protein [Flavobacterium sp.]
MKWVTEVNVPKYNFDVNHRQKQLFLGSCFATHISNKFSYFGFNQVYNPFGVLFSPIACANLISSALLEKSLPQKHIINRDDHFFSLDAHSEIFGSTTAALQKRLDDASQKLRTALLEADVLFLTLGTAFVYRYLHTGDFVANCQKVPANQFEKVLLTVDEITNDLQASFDLLRQYNPKIKIVLTVSPVRHTRDGLIENQRSKAQLLLTIEKLLCTDAVFYFPSYEIMIDELRDYRFYESDLIHPNQMAVDYIWEKFEASFFNTETIQICKAVRNLRSFEAHSPQSKIDLHFDKLAAIKTDLISKYPFLQL